MMLSYNKVGVAKLMTELWSKTHEKKEGKKSYSGVRKMQITMIKNLL